MATFLAYTTPAAGHLFPIVPGLLALRARGHGVHVRTAASLVGVARDAGLRAEALDPRVEAITEPVHDTPTGPERLRRGLAFLMSRGPYEREDLARAVEETGADALLVDTNAYGAAVGAQLSGLPWATTLPSVLPMPGRGIPPYGPGLRPLRGPVGRVRDRVGWRRVERVYGDAMLPPLNRLRADAGLPALRSPLEHFQAPDRLIVLSGDPLEYPRGALAPNVRMVGAGVWDPPADTPGWLLEDGDPWVLVTCSTDYQGDERLAAVALEALRDEPFRVVVTLADAHGVADLPATPNARIERFVPHSAVLERAVAVVCHAGMGIAQKAIAAAVPIVAAPFGRDQFEVARRVAECGAGTIVAPSELQPERLRAAVHTAIAMRPQAEAASARLHAFGGPGAFADAAEELAPARYGVAMSAPPSTT
jgi:UDP:flavonoid glycosyltransferase YjiC (YdhE family)